MGLKRKTLSFMFVFSMLVSMVSVLSLKAIEDNKDQKNNPSVSVEEGLEVGSIIYDMDEYGNMYERVVSDEGAVTLEGAQREYNERFIGSADDGQIIEYHVISISDTGKETCISSHGDYHEAIKKYDEMIELNPTVNYAVKSQDTYWKVKYATVTFKKIIKTNSSGSTYVSTTDFVDATTNAAGYIHRDYGIDAAFLESDGNRVKFKMGAVVGWVDASLVDVLPYTEKGTYINYYKVSNGNIIHGIRIGDIKGNGSYSSVNVGYAPEYLKAGNVYYSYDGHYFYTDYFAMIDDYRSGKYSNAINPTSPYYNYYQFLPMHSQTNYSASDLNKYIASKYSAKPTSADRKDLQSHQSLLYNEGEAFTKGLEYGVNPLMSLGIAINESGWGRSSIALSKNNLFGLNAVDSNPSGQADTFLSPSHCVEVFMKQWVTWGYLDTKDYRYFGGHLGDKSSGMNVKYASDAYWGEKAASHSYNIDAYLGKKDYNVYTLAMKTAADDVNIRKTPWTSSAAIYQLKNKSYSIMNLPVIVLDEVSGTSVYGNSTWYKIYTDHALDASQDRIGRYNGESLSWIYEQLYNFDHSYGYVSGVYLTKINQGTNLIDPPIPDQPTEPETPPEPTYLKGDVNGDGKVSFLDYVAIEKHIMETKKLTGDKLSRADVNQDGKVSFLDYVAIEKHIMGTKPLF